MKKVLFVILIFSIIYVNSFASGEAEGVAYRDQLSSMSWDEIVEYAKQEGEVNWFVWYYIPQYREIAKDFETKYGIKVTIPEGDNTGNTNKVIAESKLKVGSVDSIAFGSDNFEVLKNLIYGPIDTIIPNIEDRKTGFSGFGSDGYALAYEGNQVIFSYNPLLVDKNALPQTIEDLEQFIKKYKFGFNFNGGGSGSYFIMSVLRQLSGDDLLDTNITPERIKNWEITWKWFKDNSEYYTITKSQTDSATRLSDGEFAVVAGWEGQTANLQNQGAISKKIKVYVPEFGLPGGGNLTAIPKNAPHPAAALVFLEWLTSAEAQTKMTRDLGIFPQNSKADLSVLITGDIDRTYSTPSVPGPIYTEVKKEFNEKVLQSE